MVAHSGLVIFVGTGKALSEAAEALERAPGVESVAMFGQTLRVSGTHRAVLEQALQPWRTRPGQTWAEEPALAGGRVHPPPLRPEVRR